MSDRKLIDELIVATLPRIERLVTETYAEAVREAGTLASLEAELGLPVTTAPRGSLPPELGRKLWNAALTDAAVSLLWAIGDKAPSGTFTCTPRAIQGVVELIDRKELQRDTGVPAEDLRFVLAQMGEALVSIVIRERGSLEVTIDRRLVSLLSAPA